MNANGYITTSAGDYGVLTTSGYSTMIPILYTCSQCGGYRCDGYYVGDVVGRWCTCSESYAPQGWCIPYRQPPAIDEDTHRRLLEESLEKHTDLFKALANGDRQPWECPRCRKIKAPHVDECGCKENDR